VLRCGSLLMSNARPRPWRSGSRSTNASASARSWGAWASPGSSYGPPWGLMASSIGLRAASH